MAQLGKINNESHGLYHSVDAVSRSRLCDFIDHGPLYYYKKYIAKTIVEKPSKALIEGIMAHVMVVEGEAEFNRQYAVLSADAPKKPTEKQRNAAKPSPETVFACEWWDEWTKNHPGCEIIDKEDHNRLIKMRDAVFAHPAASAVITGCESEVTFRAKGQRFLIQCRPDWFNEAVTDELITTLQQQNEMHYRSQGVSAVDTPRINLRPGQPLIVDFKTCADLDEGFEAHYAKYNYHRQVAFYRGVLEGFFGLEDVGWLFIGAEKDEPYRVVVHQPDITSVDTVGFPVVDAAMKYLMRCYETDEWPGSPAAVQPLSLPKWKINQELEYFYKHDPRNAA